jgi:hypothetical protein
VLSLKKPKVIQKEENMQSVLDQVISKMNNDLIAGEEANEELMKERFMLRSHIVLDSAWMSYQQLGLSRRRDPPPKFSDSDKLLD